MEQISLKAYAKINLGLDVVGKLENGYHEVRMIMQSIDLFDKVNIKLSREKGVHLVTNLKYLPTGPDNLACKAANLLMEEFGIEEGIDIDLYKFIPVAAGMAGGSTDAAAVLKGVNSLFSLGLSVEQLMERGKTLGADIPYCLMGGTALAQGIGEKLTRLPDCPACHVVIAKPGVSVSTKAVYSRLELAQIVHPDIDGIMEGISGGNIIKVCECMGNVLETVTITDYPVIEDIKKMMRKEGALNAMMSGSGPTVFGIFDDGQKAARCSDFLRKRKEVRNSYVCGLINP